MLGRTGVFVTVSTATRAGYFARSDANRRRRQPALASPHRDRQLPARAGLGARRGGRRRARDRGVRAVGAERARADPRGARGPRTSSCGCRSSRGRSGGGRAGAASAGLPVERVVGPLDVFHFSDWMYPPQRGGVRATTVHDLVPLRFPELVEPSDAPDARRRSTRTPRARATSSSRTRASRPARWSSCSACPRSGSSSRTRGSTRASGRTASAADLGGPYVLARLDARAAQEPPGARRGVRAAAARAAGADARARRALGLGGPAARCRRRAAARLRLGRRAGAALPRRVGVRVPVDVRGLRDAGRGGARQRHAGRRLVASVARRGLRRRGPARRSRTTRKRSRPRSSRPLDELRAAAGSPTRPDSPGARAARPSSRATRALCETDRDAGRHGRLGARAHARGDRAAHPLAARSARGRGRRGAPLRLRRLGTGARARARRRLVPRRSSARGAARRRRRPPLPDPARAVPISRCRSSSRSTTSPCCGTRRPSTAGRATYSRHALPRVVRAARAADRGVRVHARGSCSTSSTCPRRRCA